MNNRTHPVTYVTTLPNAGTVPVVASFGSPFSPPTEGWVYRLSVVASGGTSTTVTVALVNDNGVDPAQQLARWPNYSLPFDAADVPISWDVATASHLQIVCTTDDAGNASTLVASLKAGAA